MTSYDWIDTIPNLEINSGRMKYSNRVDFRKYTVIIMLF
jgi:hypothetical protein